MKRIAGLMPALFALAALSAPPLSELSASDRADLLRVAGDVRSAIVRADVDALLANVSSSMGLVCTDTNYSHKQVRRDLHNRNSYLYMSLFDTARFAAKCGGDYPAETPWISDKDFFMDIGDSPMDITFAKDDYATVTYRSTIKAYYPREYSFHKENGRWKLVYGVTIGSCSCG